MAQKTLLQKSTATQRKEEQNKKKTIENRIRHAQSRSSYLNEFYSTKQLKSCNVYASILHFHATKNGIINIYRSWKINLCEICLRTGRTLTAVGRGQQHCSNNNATQSTAAAVPFKFPNNRNVSNFVRLLSIQRNEFT